MKISITQQGKREEAQKVIDRVIANLYDVYESWDGMFTVTFKPIFVTPRDIFQKKAGAKQ